MASTQRERLDAIKTIIRSDKNAVAIVEEAGITITPKPSDLPSRPGYKWVPTQTTAKGSITWIEKEDPNAEGTAEKPITFVPGMRVYPNYYYTNGTTRFVCIKKGTPSELVEGEYFTEF